MENANYKAKFIAATKDLTAKERIRVKRMEDCISLDEATQENGRVLIDVDYVAFVEVHNEKADNPDYMKYIFADKDGQLYVTGSEVMYRAYEEIADEMEDEDEAWTLVVYRKPSNNYKGKDFLTCGIA